MCRSNRECKYIRRHLHRLTLEEHSNQLDRCHECLCQKNSLVHSATIMKTDQAVRLSYVSRYRAFVNGLWEKQRIS